MKSKKLLSMLVDQFKLMHRGREPKKIIVDPLALVALGAKRSIAPSWNGIEVECREIGDKEMTKPAGGTCLGIFMDVPNSQVVACSLSTVA